MKFKNINPILGNIEPSFLHFHSKKTSISDQIHTTVTFCNAITSRISIELFEKGSSIYKEIFFPDTLYNELLCSTGQLKITHKEDLLVILYDAENKEFLKSSSDGKISLNYKKIKVIHSKKSYFQFKYNKSIEKNYLTLFSKVYNRIYLKIRYIQISIKRLILIFAKTIFSIIKYIFTSRLR